MSVSGNLGVELWVGVGVSEAVGVGPGVSVPVGGCVNVGDTVALGVSDGIGVIVGVCEGGGVKVGGLTHATARGPKAYSAPVPNKKIRLRKINRHPCWRASRRG